MNSGSECLFTASLSLTEFALTRETQMATMAFSIPSMGTETQNSISLPLHSLNWITIA